MKIYIGNIAYDSTESQLLELLTPFEPIFEFNYPKDRSTGSFRGFAFAVLPDRETGEDAIKKLNGTDFRGREIRVKEAETEAPRPTRGAPPGFRKSGDHGFQPGPRRR